MFSLRRSAKSLGSAIGVEEEDEDEEEEVEDAVVVVALGADSVGGS